MLKKNQFGAKKNANIITLTLSIYEFYGFTYHLIAEIITIRLAASRKMEQ
jgi:hypothetical protein